MEQWRKIDGYDYYFVSNLGNVKSESRFITKKDGTKKPVKGIIMKPKKSKCGYYRVGLVDQFGNQKFLSIHRLVLITFHGLHESKNQVNHINGDKSDNRLENLEWVSCSENQKHAHSIGLKCQKGENHAQARLTSKDVIEIRNLINQGIKQRIIAEKYGVKRSYISEIKIRRRWNHI
jgi:predicted XRE-type DNA-binding protein